MLPTLEHLSFVIVNYSTHSNFRLLCLLRQGIKSISKLVFVACFCHISGTGKRNLGIHTWIVLRGGCFDMESGEHQQILPGENKRKRGKVFLVRISLYQPLGNSNRGEHTSTISIWLFILVQTSSTLGTATLY